MNIVLDTNVLVAGLLTPFGTCGEIVRMVSSGELVLLLDARIISEYREVLGRPKFQFDQDKVDVFLEYAEYRGVTIASSPLLDSLPDPDDEPFLEIAIAGRARCVITGNRNHFPTELRHGIEIFSPAEFLTFYKNYRKTGGRT